MRILGESSNSSICILAYLIHLSTFLHVPLCFHTLSGSTPLTNVWSISNLNLVCSQLNIVYSNTIYRIFLTPNRFPFSSCIETFHVCICWSNCPRPEHFAKFKISLADPRNTGQIMSTGGCRLLNHVKRIGTRREV